MWASERLLVGVYGPTEATICAGLWRVDPDDVQRAHLGRPVAGARFRNEGCELWIGGPGLALGYLDGDRGRFVDDGGERWFRTGDAVRVDDDGVLLFAGRIDRQAKVDGRLVCPEEVESALVALPGVVSARVDVVHRSGAAILEARVEGEGLAVAALRDQLDAVLPPWMIPRRIDLGELQRGPTGKAVRQDVLARTISEVLGRAVQEGESLAGAGLDSMRALDAAARLMAEGIAIAPEQLRHADRLEALREGLRPPARRIGDLLAEARALRVPGPATASSSEVVLLTGATGGLGGRVLPRLVRRGHPVVALVRAADEPSARTRLREALACFGEDPGLADEVDVVAGALPSVEIRMPVGSVMHLAAEVDLSASAGRLWPSNVEGTLALLRLGRPMFFASTLSVFVDSDAPRGVFHATDALPDAALAGGYAQTKLVAEALVRGSELPTCAVRYGLLSPDREHLHFGSRDWLRLSVRGLRGLGCVPEDADGRALEVDLTPVDAAAELSVDLLESLLHGEAPKVAHVAASEPLSVAALLEAVSRDVPLERVSPDRFLERARSTLARSRTAAEAAALLGLVRALSPDALDVHRSLDLFQATGCRFDPIPGIPSPTPDYVHALVSSALSEEP